MTTMDQLLNYKNFEVLVTNLCDEQLRAKIRLLLVYGCNGEEVMFATDEDEVYCYGRNRFGGLGLGHTQENVQRAQLNTTLSGEQVIDVFTGFEHWMALTATGRLFAWGHNTSGQLGISGVTQTQTPLLVDDLQDEKIVKVCLGGFHSMALTRNGRVFAWGRNYFGQVGDGRHSECRFLPIHIDIGITIVDISCGVNHSMALTIDQQVLVWGENKRAQLGRPYTEMKYHCQPIIIPGLSDICFSKIVCGPSYSVVLTTDGSVYTFGDNSSGQIGNGDVGTQFSPHRVQCDAQFKDIIAHKENEITIALTTDDRYYVWGLANNRRITSPKELNVTSEETAFDIYAKYAKTKLTFKTIVIQDCNGWQPISSPQKYLSESLLRQIDRLDEDDSQLLSSSSSSIASTYKQNQKTIDDICDLSKLLSSSIISEFGESVRKTIRLMKTFNDSKAIFATHDDNVYAIGINSLGLLGLGTSEEHIKIPQLNPYLSGKQLIDIAHGFEFCIGLTHDGKCYAWGNNKYGELGLGTLTPTNVPQLIEYLSDLQVVQIRCGPYHSMALTSEGDLFSWGYNTFGQVGDRTYTNRTQPTQVLINEPVASISCGRAHSLALTQTGRVYVWGLNEKGQLGRPRERDIRPGRIKAMSYSPTLLNEVSAFTIEKAICGPNHSLLLTSDGCVYSFGENTNGQVGNGSTENQFTPVKLNSTIKVKDIVSFWENDLSLAVSEDNKYYVWGLVQKKEIRLMNEVVTRPKRVQITDERSMFDIYAKCAKKKATFKTILIDDETTNFQRDKVPNTPSNGIHNFTMNGSAQSYNWIQSSNHSKIAKKLVKHLAVDDLNLQPKSLYSALDIKLFPILNTTLTNDHMNQIKLLAVFGYNGAEVIFVTKDDKVYAYGQNKSGCLGLGTFEKHIPEPKLNTVLSNKRLINIFYGFEYCIGLTVDGKCYAWGQNCFGQLGLGSKVSTARPEMITRLYKENIVSVSCGQNHTLALSDQGKVFAWGHNVLGQLGDGTYEERLVPTHIQIIHPIISISCGRNHSSAIAKNRFVYFWGHNESGQLGRDRQFDYRPERKQYIIYKPVLNRSFKNYGRVTRLVCGQNYSLFLTSDGDVYGFGDNTCGQIGNGSTEVQITPHKVEGIKFKEIIAVKENDLSIGISKDNKCYVWGLANNRYVLTPTQINEWPEQTLFDIYAKYSKNKVTYKTVIINETQSTKSRREPDLTEESKIEEFMATAYDGGDDNFDQFSTASRAYDLSSLQIDSSHSIADNIIPNEEIPSNGCDGSSSGDNLSVNTFLTEASVADNILTNRLKDSFNDHNSSDLQFLIGDQVIHCHKTIIELRNEKFWKLLSSKLTDGFKIKVASASYDAFYQFIRFLYGFEAELKEHNVTDLQAMAQAFNEQQLLDQCTEFIKALEYTPNISNVCTLYEKAVTEDICDLMNACIEFAADHWKPICQTYAFKTMDDQLSKRFMIAVVNLQCSD